MGIDLESGIGSVQPNEINLKVDNLAGIIKILGLKPNNTDKTFSSASRVEVVLNTASTLKYEGVATI